MLFTFISMLSTFWAVEGTKAKDKLWWMKPSRVCYLISVSSNLGWFFIGKAASSVYLSFFFFNSNWVSQIFLAVSTILSF